MCDLQNDVGDIALCITCSNDLENKTYTLDDFTCIPITSLSEFYDWPQCEQEIERYLRLHSSIDTSSIRDVAATWTKRHFRPNLPSRRHKFCVAVSLINTSNQLYLVSPAHMLIQRAPFFTIVCVNLNLRRSTKKTTQRHFQLHTHIVRKMANAADPINALHALESLVCDTFQPTFGQEPSSVPPKKRPKGKDISMNDPPPKRTKTTPSKQTTTVAVEPAPTGSYVRYQKGDSAPVVFDVGGANSSFELRIQSADADSDDFVLTVNVK